MAEAQLAVHAAEQDAAEVERKARVVRDAATRGSGKHLQSSICPMGISVLPRPPQDTKLPVTSGPRTNDVTPPLVAPPHLSRPHWPSSHLSRPHWPPRHLSRPHWPPRHLSRPHWPPHHLSRPHWPPRHLSRPHHWLLVVGQRASGDVEQPTIAGGVHACGECAAGDIGHVALDDEGVVDDVSFGCVVEGVQFKDLGVPLARRARLEGARRRTHLDVVHLFPLADQCEGEVSVLAPTGGLRLGVGGLQVHGHEPTRTWAVSGRVNTQPPVLLCGGAGEGRERLGR